LPGSELPARQLLIVRGQPLFDLPQLIPAALRSGTDAVVKVAEALGAKTTTDRCG
jgi:hypothetical protein